MKRGTILIGSKTKKLLEIPLVVYHTPKRNSITLKFLSPFARDCSIQLNLVISIKG